MTMVDGSEDEVGHSEDSVLGFTFAGFVSPQPAVPQSAKHILGFS